MSKGNKKEKEDTNEIELTTFKSSSPVPSPDTVLPDQEEVSPVEDNNKKNELEKENQRKNDTNALSVVDNTASPVPPLDTNDNKQETSSAPTPSPSPLNSLKDVLGQKIKESDDPMMQMVKEMLANALNDRLVESIAGKIQDVLTPASDSSTKPDTKLNNLSNPADTPTPTLEASRKQEEKPLPNKGLDNLDSTTKLATKPPQSPDLELDSEAIQPK